MIPSERSGDASRDGYATITPVTQDEVRDVLNALAEGALDAHQAEARLLDLIRRAPFEDLGFARVDHHRAARQGYPEVIYGAGKTPPQIAAIAERIVSTGNPLLVTRTTPEAFDAVRAVTPDVQWHETARIIARPVATQPTGRGTVLVAAAGTSDMPVAEEARVSAETLGNRVDALYDVGVAGLHRLLAERERLDAARVVIVVAGMEGALPSVVGGLVRTPVIAVPTSVGYGASFGGLAALLGMLNSCASGVVVVNIDNGLGAAVMAHLINHLE